MNISDRYASAIHSSNLKSKPETSQSDSDVLGAAGYAGKETLWNGRPGAPLAMALARLFAGDNRAAPEIVNLLADWAWTKAQTGDVRLRRVESVDMARAVLAWHRDGICRPCAGTGYQRIPGTPHLSEKDCQACKGTKKRPFVREFKSTHVPLAFAVLAELDRELSRAGPAAMAAIAPRLEL